MDRRLKREETNERQRFGMVLVLNGEEGRPMPFIALQQVGPSCNIAVTVRISIRQLDIERKKSSNRRKEYRRIQACITRLPTMLAKPHKGFHTGIIDHYARIPPLKEL